MWVQAHHHRITIFDSATEPFNDIAVHIGAVTLNSCWQIENQWICGCRLNDIHDCFAHFNRVFGFGEREAFGRVFVTHDCSGQGVFHRLAFFGSVNSNSLNARLVKIENHIALQWVR